MVAVENDPETTGPDVHPLTRMRRRSPGTPFRDAAFPEVVASIGSE
jgi:hypothetical protein